MSQQRMDLKDSVCTSRSPVNLGNMLRSVIAVSDQAREDEWSNSTPILFSPCIPQCEMPRCFGFICFTWTIRNPCFANSLILQGGEPQHAFTTTKAILDDLSKIDWRQLPATIADAVSVTRSLGIRYLWVDALCIVQDDEEDKTREIREMGRIYRYARVTIAAANSPSVQCGFLNSLTRDEVPLPIVLSETRNEFGTLWTRKGPRTPDEPLDKRGWALQEYLLSPRVLYYGSLDLLWRCQKQLFQPVLPTQGIYQDTSAFAQGRIRLPTGVFEIPSQNLTPLTDYWYWIQRAYSPRELGYFNDRFQALGGIAESVGEFSNSFFFLSSKSNCKNGVEIISSCIFPHHINGWSFIPLVTTQRVFIKKNYCSLTPCIPGEIGF
jgi:Heterokaryon incompatibility protein (HET)